jgi:anti-sigma factor RsiW
MSVVCDRARSQISRQLDGELSQLEARMLETHLERCSDCHAFAADVSAFTFDLRSAPLQQLAHPVEIRKPRRASVPVVRIGIAAAVAVAVFGSLLQFASYSSSSKVSLPSPTRFESTSQVQNEVRTIIADGKAFKRHGGNDWAV